MTLPVLFLRVKGESVLEWTGVQWYVLLGMLIRVAKQGLLIARLQYFGSWTLVISLRKKPGIRKCPNKGIDLGG